MPSLFLVVTLIMSALCARGALARVKTPQLESDLIESFLLLIYSTAGILTLAALEVLGTQFGLGSVTTPQAQISVALIGSGLASVSLTKADSRKYCMKDVRAEPLVNWARYFAVLAFIYQTTVFLCQPLT
jgi:hypothetical protein